MGYLVHQREGVLEFWLLGYIQNQAWIRSPLYAVPDLPLNMKPACPDEKKSSDHAFIMTWGVDELATTARMNTMEKRLPPSW